MAHSRWYEANRPLFEKVYGTVAEIRRLRVVAQSLAQEVAGSGEGSTESTEECGWIIDSNKLQHQLVELGKARCSPSVILSASERSLCISREILR